MRKKTDNALMVAIGVIVAIFLLSFLFGCKTTKTVTETVHDHDTLIMHKTDTFVDVKVKVVYDTVKQIESHFVTINDVGDTIKEVHHYHDIMRTLVIDSTQRYQAKVDSLKKVIDKQKEAMEKTIKKGLNVPWWAWIISPLILILGIFYIARWAASKK